MVELYQKSSKNKVESISILGALNENRALKITLGILDGYLHLI